MKPALNKNGFFLVVASAAFVVVGTLLSSWPLVGLGFIMVSCLTLLYVLFIPYAAMFRRKQLEFAWWIPASELNGGSALAGQSLQLHLLYRNHSPLAVVDADLEILASSPLRIESERERFSLPPLSEVRTSVEITPEAVGQWCFQGALLKMRDRFGVFSMQAYFPNLLTVKVFPRLGMPRVALPVRPQTGTLHERTGPRLLRRRGLGTDLREIREHTPGDPFKHIAWKATARAGKLMVRDFESEILVTHQFLLDISPGMRKEQRPGYQWLDGALNQLATIARVALDSGDRVGLITFDTRIYDELKPAEGAPQLMRVMEKLTQLRQIVDEDLTDLTDAELAAAVADYIAYQEGVNVRVSRVPAPGSKAWDRLIVGPQGDLIDAIFLAEAVDKSLSKGRRSQTRSQTSLRPAIVASGTFMTQLRRFALERGIELPYRRQSPVNSAEEGLVAALDRAAASRASRFIVIISNLLGIRDGAVLAAPLRLAKRRGHQVVVIVPRAPEPTRSEDERRIYRIEQLAQRRQRAAIRRELAGMGVNIVEKH
jgi:uncharacterized protein (DUF58 family)